MFPKEIYLDPNSSESNPEDYPPCRYGVALQFNAEPGMVYDAYATYLRDTTVVPPERLYVHFDSGAPITKVFNSLENGVQPNQFRLRSQVGVDIERGDTVPIRLQVVKEGELVLFKIAGRVIRGGPFGNNWRDLGRS